MDNALLATLFLIGGEVMLFAGLVSAFWVLRVSAPAWPPPLHPRLPVGVTGLNTLVLLGSSAMVLNGVRALRRRTPRNALYSLVFRIMPPLTLLQDDGYIAVGILRESF